MTVWIVTGSDSYDHERRNIIEGVYATRKAAEVKAAEIGARAQGLYERIDIAEHQVEAA